MTTRLQSGLYVLQIAILNDNDEPMGTLTTPNAPTFNTVYSPYLVPAPVSYTAAADTVDSVQSFAGQRLRGRRDLGASAFGDGTLELSEFDDVFDALVQGYTLDTTTATGLRIHAHNANRSLTRRFMLAFTAAATPSNGALNYDTIFTFGTLRRSALGTNQTTGKNPNNRSYTLTKVVISRTPWGQLFSNSTLAPSSGTDDEVGIYADAPITFSTWVSNGTASAWTLPYALEYSAAAAFGSANIAALNGTASAQSIVGVSGGTAVLQNGVVTSGQKWFILGPSTAILYA